MTAVFRPFWHGHGTDALWHFQLILSMQTTGACEDPLISAGNLCSPRSCMRAVVRPRCTFCTTLTCKPQVRWHF
jgi:hypothetical protein